MRDSLRKSLQDSKGADRFPAGSIVICNACALPVFRLDRGISPGDRMGRMASAFVPVSPDDLLTLALRNDIDAGVRAWAGGLTADGRREHCAKLRAMHAGDPALCPCCGQGFLQVLSVEKHEVLDRAYVVEPVVILPKGYGKTSPIRGRQIGAKKDWVH